MPLALARPTFLMLVALLTLSASPAVFADPVPEDPRAAIARLEAENAALRARVSELERQLAEQERQSAALSERATKAEAAARTASQNAADLVPYSQLLFERPAGESGPGLVAIVPGKAVPVSGTRSPTWLELSYTHAAGRRAEVRTLAGKLSAFQNGPENVGTKTLTFTADGQRVQTGVTAYDSNRRRVAIPGKPATLKDDEFLSFELTVDQLRTLAPADKVTVGFGPSVVELTREQVTSLRGLLKSLEK
jgi:hypothetical protein